MNIAFCSNFTYPSIGGSEIVVKNVSEYFTQYFSRVVCYGYNVNKRFQLNDVCYCPCFKGGEIVNQIKDFDHIFIYSDSFWGWKDILLNLNKIRGKITIVLLGMYNMLSNKHLLDIFVNNISKFNVIVHSDNYIDFHKCKKIGIEPKVIPNGVDISEFYSKPIDFRQEYNIKTKYILLNVSNYFYGKGQLYFDKILKHLDIDYTLVSVSQDIKYPFDERFLRQSKQKCEKYNTLFLRNIPREHVVSAFKSSDVFIFPSLKEVFPLVILESMASGLPFISLDVGNVNEYGIKDNVIKQPLTDQKGYKIFDEKISKLFSEKIKSLLSDRKKYIVRSQQGIDMSKKYDWNIILDKYRRNIIG